MRVEDGENFAEIDDVCKGRDCEVQFHLINEAYDGVVYWQPPKQALDKELVYEPSISRYGNDEGIPELIAALVKKLIKREKGIRNEHAVGTGGKCESN